RGGRSGAGRGRNTSPTPSGVPPRNTPNGASSRPRRTPADQHTRTGDHVSQGVLNRVRTQTLEIAYEESGPADGSPVLLMHGFPYDVRAYDEVVPLLVAAGRRVIVPYLRGYGPTRFLSADTPRSGQQAALGKDLLDFLDALRIERAALAGYDWGGRAACIVAALWPARVHCLVSGGGYNLQNIAASAKPLPPEQEHRFWYQYYF